MSCSNVILERRISVSNQCLTLPTKWNQLQKEELIRSCIKGNSIGQFYAINIPQGLQIVDGVRRIETILSFAKNRFCVNLSSKSFWFEDLAKCQQAAIIKRNLPFTIFIQDKYQKRNTENLLVHSYKSINFAGNLCDAAYLDLLTKMMRNDKDKSQKKRSER